MRPDAREATVIILVAGMAALLLSMALAVLIRARTLGAPSDRVMAEAQNRIALGSALVYLQETSRLGWGAGPGQHAYGWTDVRDGEPGPRGPAHPSTGAIQRLSWSPGGAYPAPGAAMRGDMFAWELPPYAVQQEVAPNPLRLADADAQMEGPTGWKGIIGTPQGTHAAHPGDQNDAMAPPYWQRATTRTRNEGANGYISQPVLNTWAQFSAGDQRVRRQSVGLAWFRIYRETDSDHNGDNDPWYDTVPMAGHGIFIITVGSGGTRGFRFWDPSTDYLNGRTALPSGSAGYSAAIEAVTASSSGMFMNEDVFSILRAEEHIAWYRVQWVANTSSGLDALAMGSTRNMQTQNLFSSILTNTDPTNDHNALPHAGGAIRWIQRLEQEPPRW